TAGDSCLISSAESLVKWRLNLVIGEEKLSIVPLISRRDRAVAILNPFISRDDVLSFCFNDSAVDHVLSGTPEEESAKPSLFTFISGPEGVKSLSAPHDTALLC